MVRCSVCHCACRGAEKLAARQNWPSRCKRIFLCPCVVFFEGRIFCTRKSTVNNEKAKSIVVRPLIAYIKCHTLYEWVNKERKNKTKKIASRLSECRVYVLRVRKSASSRVPRIPFQLEWPFRINWCEWLWKKSEPKKRSKNICKSLVTASELVRADVTVSGDLSAFRFLLLDTCIIDGISSVMWHFIWILTVYASVGCPGIWDKLCYFLKIASFHETKGLIDWTSEDQRVCCFQCINRKQRILGES